MSKSERIPFYSSTGRQIDAHFSVHRGSSEACLAPAPKGIRVKFHARGGSKKGKTKPTNPEYSEGLLTMCRRLVLIPGLTISVGYLDTKKVQDAEFSSRWILPLALKPGDLKDDKGTAKAELLKRMINRGQSLLSKNPGKGNTTRAFSLVIHFERGVPPENLIDWLSRGPTHCSVETTRLLGDVSLVDCILEGILPDGMSVRDLGPIGGGA